MKRFFCILLPLAFMPAGCSYFSSRAPSESKAGRPVKMDPAQADAIVRNIEKDRRETEEWLREKPTSYLAAIARIDFGDNSTLTVGSAPGNDVRLSAPDIEPHHLKVTVDGDHFHIDVIDSKATFMIEGKVQRDATVDPSYIQVGRFNLRLSHQHFPAIIVFDPQSPRMKDYKGLKYFPVDLSYRYELPLIPNPRREKIIILSTQGNRRSAERIGRFDFYVGNTLCRLSSATRRAERNPIPWDDT
jgi:uncharacterized protein (DUF1684 family)